jgi:hypothetical protein
MTDKADKAKAETDNKSDMTKAEEAGREMSAEEAAEANRGAPLHHVVPPAEPNNGVREGAGVNEEPLPPQTEEEKMEQNKEGE